MFNFCSQYFVCFLVIALSAEESLIGPPWSGYMNMPLALASTTTKGEAAGESLSIPLALPLALSYVISKFVPQFFPQPSTNHTTSC